MLLSKFGGASIGGLAPLGALFGAALGGDVIGNMLSPHNVYAEAGGAAGAVGGFFGMEALMANPAFLAALGPYAIPALIGGTLLAALFGGKAGSLFGDHFSQADEPDIYQTQQWGQELARSARLDRRQSNDR